MLQRLKEALHAKSIKYNKYKEAQRSKNKTTNGNPSEELNLLNRDHTKQLWSKMATNIAEKTRSQPAETLMMSSNWRHRQKQEVLEVVDLSASTQEKYGPD